MLLKTFLIRQATTGGGDLLKPVHTESSAGVHSSQSASRFHYKSLNEQTVVRI